MTSPRIRPIDAASEHEIALVATRMRATLVEVLGEARGASMYTMEWLRERVLFHLDPARAAAVFVAEDARGAIAGHTIVRVEVEGEGRSHGLFSTTYVAPDQRRGGVAEALLLRGEAWMRARGLARAATHTSAANAKLIALYEKHGYAIDLAHGEMVRLARTLP